MSVSSLQSSSPTGDQKPSFRKVAENLYRLNTSGRYYALLKRGGKQIRKSLRTTDKELAKRRLSEFREKVGRLNSDKGVRKITFNELVSRWLGVQATKLKRSSAMRNEACVKALAPFFKGVVFKNITRSHCEDWLTKRGQRISASSYKQERRVLIALYKYAISLGIVLDNVAEEALPTRSISSKQVIIPTREQFDLMARTIRLAISKLWESYPTNLIQRS